MRAHHLAAGWTDWFVEETFLNNEPWRWLALFGVLLVSFVVGKGAAFALTRWGGRLRKHKGISAAATVLESLAGPVTMFALAGGLYFAATFMNLSYRSDGVVQSFQPFWLNACRTITVLAMAWFIFRLVDLIEVVLNRWTSKTETQLDDQLVPMIRKAMRVFVVIVAALFIAQNVFRWDIGALIAGLGVGGLAMALAAKEALSNIFGSITILTDRPFQLDDWVRIADYEGIIEEVGFRSTRVRTFFGHLIVIPNNTVASVAVDNVSARGFIRRNLNITVTYDTPPEKMEEAFAILHDMLDARKDHWAPDREPKVVFSDFNAASLNILVVYWYAPPDYWEAQAFNHEFNMELLRRFNEAGIEFAFPTQTLYVKQDSPFEAQITNG
ncbi:MAG: mechanosensitive ion channel family protein [Phycisphaerae bacterium]|nr:mechanosensitive ion channel family protein [Phycisphaerae bacterium]